MRNMSNGIYHIVLVLTIIPMLIGFWFFPELVKLGYFNAIFIEAILILIPIIVVIIKARQEKKLES